MTSVTIFDEYSELTDEQGDTFTLEYSPPMVATKKPKNRKPVKRSVKRCKDTIDWVDEVNSSVEALNQASVDEYSSSGGNNEN